MGYLSDSACILICKWVEKKIGLVLTMEKKYLVEHRLDPVATMNGFASIDELVDETLKGKNKLLEQQVIDSLVTNETYFFRDPDSFVDLKEIINSDIVEFIPKLLLSVVKEPILLNKSLH